MKGILDDLINPAELDHAAGAADTSHAPAVSATTAPAAPDEGDGIAEVFQYPLMRGQK